MKIDRARAKKLLSIRDELRRLDGSEESIYATIVSQKLALAIVRAERIAVLAQYKKIEKELKELGIEISDTESDPQKPDVRGIFKV